MKQELFDQLEEVKTPIDTSGKVYIHGYRRSGGTFVKSHWRKLPKKRIGIRTSKPTSKSQLILFKSV